MDVAMLPKRDRIREIFRQHFAEGALHLVTQHAEYRLLRIKLRIAILQPLEIGDDDAPCIGQNIGDNDGSLLVEILIGFACDRRICSFYENASLDLLHVIFANLILQSSKEQHVHIEIKNVLTRKNLRLDAALLNLLLAYRQFPVIASRELDKSRNVQPFFVV